jgi:hypothetical protein
MMKPAFGILTEFSTSGRSIDSSPGLRLSQEELLSQRVQAVAAERYAAGFELAQAESNDLFETRSAEMLQEFELRLERERTGWIAELAQELEKSLREGFECLEARLSESVARLLEPIVSTHLYELTMRDVSSSLRRAIATGVTVQITSEQDLYEAVCRAAEIEDNRVRFRSSENGNMRIVVDDTVIEAVFDGLISPRRAGE